MNKRSTLKRNLLGYVFSLTIIVIVFLNLDLIQIKDTFSHIHWKFLILAFGIYLVNYSLRTLRFRTLLKLESVSFIQLYGISSLYGMYLYMLPAKSGEVSLPVIFKNYLGIKLVRGTATLILARILDFLTVVFLLPMAVIPFWREFNYSLRWGIIFFFVLVIIGISVSLWIIRTSREWKFWLKPSERKIDRIKLIFAKILTNLSEIENSSNHTLLIILSVGIWICVILNFYFILLALGYSLTLFQIMVITIIMVPISLFPIQGFANIGTHEVGWVVAFSLFDYPKNIALNIAISTHIILFFLVLCLGVIGFLCLAIRKNEKL